MKKNRSVNNSGIEICDSITMSVRRRKINFRKITLALLATLGFYSVALSFLEMFGFSYDAGVVIAAILIFSLFYAIISLTGKKFVWFASASLIVFSVLALRNMDHLTDGFKFVYNFIYKISNHREINYFKHLDPDLEVTCTTLLFVFAAWFISFVIYTFTVVRPNPIPVIIVTFPLIEVGLYNGIELPVFPGILVIAYWFGLLSVYGNDAGRYNGGEGGFIRKGDNFAPKRNMRLKVTEQCAMIVVSVIVVAAAAALCVMKATDYKRSESVDNKRSEIKHAVNSFSVNDIDAGIAELTAALGMKVNINKLPLGITDRVNYKHITDLEATFSGACDGAVYIKGYTGGIYTGREWENLDNEVYDVNKEMFDDFENANIYPQDLPHIFMELATGEDDKTFSLEEKRSTVRTYVPYGAAGGEDLEYDRDLSVSSQKKGNEKYSYDFIYTSANNAAGILGEKQSAEYSFLDLENREQIIDFTEKKGIPNRYNSVSLDVYLKNGLKSVKTGATDGDALMAGLLENEYREFVYDNYLYLPDTDSMAEIYDAFSDILEKSKTAITAKSKIELLKELRDRISSMTEYTLSPGRTPSNRDFVNYFLFENRKGYCSHFASAGAVLARMAGIPSRYAVGYIVISTDFNENTKNGDGSYTIKVADDRSHAWTEIYLDGFGWVPFEFTTGFSDSSVFSQSQMTTTPAVSGTTDFTRPTVNTPLQNSDSERADKPGTQTLTAAVTQTETVSSPPNTGNLPEANENGGISVITICIFCALSLAVLTLLVFIRRFIILRNRKKRFSEGGISGRIIEIYFYAEKLLAFIGENRENRSYSEFAAAAEEKYGGRYFEKGEFIRLKDIAIQSSFGRSEPEPEDLVFSLDFAERFAKKIYRNSKLYRKFYMKIIAVLI